MKVFIDGKAGTTGLRIYQRLEQRGELTLLSLSEEDRKKPECRAEMLNACDVAFLCLPDAAAREAVAMIQNPEVCVIDTSTAHRTAEGWSYGFPELGESFRNGVQKENRIAVPGCHASGFIALVYPLVEAGLLPRETLLSCHSVTGYSGGGKSMIAGYQDEQRPLSFSSPRQYGLGQTHKHLPEMTAVTGINTSPIFSPIVADFYSGMAVTVPLFPQQLNHAGMEEVKAVLREKYTGPVVQYAETIDTDGFLPANKLSGKDSMQISVLGNESRMLLVALYDNLGKGASGAALQCMNIRMGLPETAGLDL